MTPPPTHAELGTLRLYLRALWYGRPDLTPAFQHVLACLDAWDDPDPPPPDPIPPHGPWNPEPSPGPPPTPPPQPARPRELLAAMEAVAPMSWGAWFDQVLALIPDAPG